MRTFVYGFIVFVDYSWYPPGHGDMYQALYNSGLLEKFIKEGKEYIFSSNIDNLGATVDMCIFSRMVDKEKPRTKTFSNSTYKGFFGNHYVKKKFEPYTPVRSNSEARLKQFIIVHNLVKSYV